ncbi:tyrosine-type recombinase/integrase [Cyclobacterium sp.]|uniref:tyrosine-type recombinase/integrase n=1 Tax=Cyclobacterium sp. TaxID=1966343 RepID=UPI00344CDBE0
MPKQAIKATFASSISPFFHPNIGGMRTSVYCRIKIDRVNSDGFAPVYLQVIINSKKTTISLKISWPVEFFDTKAGVFLPRKKKDQLANDYNLLVNKEIAKINDIFMFYRHSDMELSIEQFHKDLKRYGARKDFIIWAENDIEDRFNAFMIEKQTYKNELSGLRKIKSFKSEIPFSEINKEFLETFKAWLIKHEGLKLSSTWRILKTMTTYVRRAYAAGISVNIDSISQFSMPKYPGRKVYLKPEEIEKLKIYYNEDHIPEHHKRVLCHFLFSCISGLRFSDIKRAKWSDIHDDLLIIVPYKTRKTEKTIKIPLRDEHFAYILTEKGYLFETVSDQVTNRTLKEIAANAGIRKNLTTHVARHTFATQFLRRGGHVEVLQKLMGHEKISTTLEYTHVDDDRLREEMKFLVE